MKNTGAILVFVCLLFLFSCKKSVQKPEFPVNCDTFCENTNNLLEKAGFTGTVLVAQNDEIVFTKGYGLTDSRDLQSAPCDENTVFEIGSITKQMTACAIMQLVEKKKINLDDPITKFLPELSNFAGRPATGNTPAHPGITIRHLLTMRAGLSDHINVRDNFFTTALLTWLDQFYKEPYSLEQSQELGLTRELMLSAINEAPVLAQPGKTYFYSNTSYYLLALVIEKASGLTYDQYITKNIFKKAGMTSSNLESGNTTAKGYFNKRPEFLPKALALGCGDINSTALDLLNWNQAFTGGKIVKPKTFDLMTQTESYGFGIYNKADENLLFHGGATCTFSSYNAYCTDTGISVILLSNQSPSSLNASFLGYKIVKLLRP